MQYKKTNLSCLFILVLILIMQVCPASAGFRRTNPADGSKDSHAEEILVIDSIGKNILSVNDLKKHIFSHRTLRWIQPLLYANHQRFRIAQEKNKPTSTDLLVEEEKQFQVYTEKSQVWDKSEVTFEQLSLLAFSAEERESIRLGYTAFLLIKYAEFCPPDNKDFIDTPFEVKASEEIAGFCKVLEQQVGQSNVAALRDARKELAIAENAIGVSSVILPCQDHSDIFEDNEVLLPAHPAHSGHPGWRRLTAEKDSLVSQGCEGGWSQITLEAGTLKALKEKLTEALAWQHYPDRCSLCENAEEKPPAAKRLKTETTDKSAELFEKASPAATIADILVPEKFPQGLGNTRLSQLVRCITEQLQRADGNNHFTECNITEINTIIIFVQVLNDIRLEDSENKNKKWANDALKKFFGNAKFSPTLASTIYAATGCNMLYFQPVTLVPPFEEAQPTKPFTSASGTNAHKVLDENYWNELIVCTGDVASRWYQTGVVLGIKRATLDAIKADNFQTAICYHRMLSDYLKHNGNQTPTLSHLASAIASSAGGNNCAVAEKIARKYQFEFSK